MPETDAICARSRRGLAILYNVAVNQEGVSVRVDWPIQMYRDSLRVLIVDDDPAVRHALKFGLELEGLHVDTCASGADLLSHPALHQVRCIVLDYRMPDMDGFAVMNGLAAKGVHTPVILITGPMTGYIREQASRLGASVVLEKPLLDGTLVDKIRELVT